VESLTEKVLQYQRTRSGLSDLMNDVARKVYLYPRRRLGWDDDACGEFYLFCYSRLVRLLDRFRDQGKPFESYLCSVLGWQLRNFARDRKKGERCWNVSLRLEPGKTVTHDEEPRLDGGASPLLALDSRIGRHIQTPTDRRNFLFFILKSSRHIGPEKCPALADLAGVPVDRLERLLADLRQGRAHREARLDSFRRRRNAAFCQVRLLETELATETDGGKREALSARLRKARTRMHCAMDRMARVGLAPTNKEIACILDVPKGTVDSGLYWLKKKLAPVYDPDNFRSA